MNVHLYKDVRTLDLQVMPASGVKEENFPLLIPALENTKNVFLSPLQIHYHKYFSLL